MALTNTSTLDVIIPEMVEQRAIESSWAKRVVAPVMFNQPGRTLFDMTGGNKVLNVPRNDTLTFAALTEATAPTAEAFTMTDRQLTPVMIGTDVTLSWDGRTAPDYDPIQYIAEETALAYAQAEESAATISFAALYTEASSAHEIGGEDIAVDAAILRTGISLLHTAKAPMPYNWFIDTQQWAEILQDATMVALLKDSGSNPAGFSATEGLRMDMFMGKIYGVNIWLVPGGMIEASGKRTMLCAQRAFGKAFKRIATPSSPTPSEINTDIQWSAPKRAWDIAISVHFDIGGLILASTTNNWVVDIVS